MARLHSLRALRPVRGERPESAAWELRDSARSEPAPLP